MAIDLAFPTGLKLEPGAYEPWLVASHWEQVIMHTVQGFDGEAKQTERRLSCAPPLSCIRLWAWPPGWPEPRQLWHSQS